MINTNVYCWAVTSSGHSNYYLLLNCDHIIKVQLVAVCSYSYVIGNQLVKSFLTSCQIHIANKPGAACNQSNC